MVATGCSPPRLTHVETSALAAKRQLNDGSVLCNVISYAAVYGSNFFYCLFLRTGVIWKEESTN